MDKKVRACTGHVVPGKLGAVFSSIAVMAEPLFIPNLEDGLVVLPRHRAARHGCIEAEDAGNLAPNFV